MPCAQFVFTRARGLASLTLLRECHRKNCEDFRKDLKLLIALLIQEQNLFEVAHALYGESGKKTFSPDIHAFSDPPSTHV